jgi:hypothetical protein
MNKLEEKLFEAFNSPEAYSLHGKPGFELEAHLARIAAKIALELAEKAYERGWVKVTITGYHGTTDPRMSYNEGLEQFKQEVL